MSQSQPPEKPRRIPPAPPPPGQVRPQVDAPSPPPIQVVQAARPNPLLVLFKIVTWPFAKIISALMWFISLIVREMVRSVVRFIIGLLIFALIVTVIATYGYALIQTDFDVGLAVTVMLETFADLLPLR